MTERYFEKFPIITYSNNQVVDITKRVTLLDKTTNNPYVFYPYEIADNERPDQLSHRYYDDAYRSWMVYLTNNIVDPYYEWYMTESEFNDFIEKKYGSYSLAQRKIKYYLNNWVESENITREAFNALPTSLKCYWEPVVNQTNTILNYKRKQIDCVVNTNKIVSYTVSNTNFIVDEIVDIVFDKSNIGKGQVMAANSNMVYVGHINGTYYVSDDISITPSSYIYGEESKTNTVFTSVMSVANNLSDEEMIYFKPITYYEYEFNKNEFNKTIRIMDKSLKDIASDNLRELLEE